MLFLDGRRECDYNTVQGGVGGQPEPNENTDCGLKHDVPGTDWFTYIAKGEVTEQQCVCVCEDGEYKWEPAKKTVSVDGTDKEVNITRTDVEVDVTDWLTYSTIQGGGPVLSMDELKLFIGKVKPYKKADETYAAPCAALNPKVEGD